MKLHFIDDCRLWYRKWSSWLAGIYATVSAYVLANPTVLFGLVDRLEQPWKAIAVAGSWAAMIGLPILTANLKQPALTKPNAE